MDRAAAPGPSLSKKFIFQKKVDRAAVFQNNLFPTKREVPTRRVPLVNFCLFFKRKKTDATRAFQKILLKKNCGSNRLGPAFQKNLFLTKRKVPTRRSAMTATASSAG